MSKQEAAVSREEPHVFLDYTQADLDHNFNQRAWATNAEEIIARYAERSRAARRELRYETAHYGAGPDEILDIFPAGPGAPINVFVHGGAWLNFTKDDYSFVAAPLVAAGITTIVVNFSKLPQVSLLEMIAQVRCGIRWAGENASQFGGGAAKVYVSGWSSGAHLAAMAIASVGEDALPAGFVRSAFCISGPFDLEPVMLSARGAYVKVAKEQERLLSPHYNAGNYAMPIFIACAEKDTNEFQRQSREFAAALERFGRLAGTRRFAGVNHFELAETLGDKGSPLSDQLIEQIRTAPQ